MSILYFDRGIESFIKELEKKTNKLNIVSTETRYIWKESRSKIQTVKLPLLLESCDIFSARPVQTVQYLSEERLLRLFRQPAVTKKKSQFTEHNMVQIVALL